MQESEGQIFELVLIFSVFLLTLGIFFSILIHKYYQNLKQRQLEALNNLIIGQNKERERLARDLHDELGPNLSAIVFCLDDIETEDEEILDIKKQVKQKVNSAIKEVRHISHDLMSSSLSRNGLNESIKQLQKEYKSVFKIKYFYDCQVKKFPEAQESHLYRITKELIYNSKKHSQCNLVNINLRYNESNKEIHFDYSDNGIGIPNGADIKFGIGINNIKTRVKLMNGKIKIDTSKGFKITIQIPLKT